MDWFELLFRYAWWTWEPDDRSWNSIAVPCFNLFECLAWCVFAVLVLVRYGRQRNSPIEIAYAAAFFTFGVTDFVEAFALTSSLLWIKAANLGALWGLRSHVREKNGTPGIGCIDVGQPFQADSSVLPKLNSRSGRPQYRRPHAPLARED